MKTAFLRSVLIASLIVLVASCSMAVEEEPQSDNWAGAWSYTSPSARVDAVFVQNGSRITGTLEEVFLHPDAAPSGSKYTLSAVVSGDAATGEAIVGAERFPMKLYRQENTIRVEVVHWSWKPVLERKR